MEISLKRLQSRKEIPLAWARAIALNMDKCGEFEAYLRNILSRIGDEGFREERHRGGLPGFWVVKTSGLS